MARKAAWRFSPTAPACRSAEPATRASNLSSTNENSFLQNEESRLMSRRGWAAPEAINKQASRRTNVQVHHRQCGHPRDGRMRNASSRAKPTCRFAQLSCSTDGIRRIYALRTAGPRYRKLQDFL